MALPVYGDVELDREEKHQFYGNRTPDQSRRDDLSDPPRWALDPIDPTLVGCIDLGVSGSRRPQRDPPFAFDLLSCTAQCR